MALAPSQYCTDHLWSAEPHTAEVLCVLWRFMEIDPAFHYNNSVVLCYNDPHLTG